ncbi:ThiF family adenylyltransferase [Pontiellaceae bacterium B12219]|nr:ThiF family adenylyltransferase [Pontiellaceae bacterium B12219]
MNKENQKKTDHSPVLHVTTDVIADIFNHIARKPAESGGVFGKCKGESIISRFKFDTGSENTASTYTPDHVMLNTLFKKEWNPQGIRFCGFAHSHPGGGNRPSRGDEVYAHRILNAIDDLDVLWLPIVNTLPDTGAFTLTPWAAFRSDNGVRIKRGRVRLSGDPELLHKLAKENKFQFKYADEQKTENGVLLDTLTFNDPNAVHSEQHKKDQTKQAVMKETFERVSEAYDLEVMAQSRIIAVGTGGAASWIEELARAGIQQFVLIDPDRTTIGNIATQQVYRKDEGRLKVECIRERILDINPYAEILSFPCKVQDISEETFEQLATAKLNGHETKRTILCGLTDNFYAQAYVNQLALNYGLPSLCAQVYHQGRGAEITFTYPGVTPACHRCILRSRYAHYLENEGENDITSHGTPIFATTRLNAIKGFITLAMIHHGSAHPRWGDTLERIGNRNLVLVRMDPDVRTSLGLVQFDKTFDGANTSRLFFDDAVWLPQKHESPETGYEVPCPDCHGTGNLNDAIGNVAI